jgi:hypothetical protein
MQPKKQEIKETESGVATNAMGSSSSSSGPIQTFDPLLMRKKRLKRYANMFKRTWSK